jgi:hypothetical protein
MVNTLLASMVLVCAVFFMATVVVGRSVVLKCQEQADRACAAARDVAEMRNASRQAPSVPSHNPQHARLLSPLLESSLVDQRPVKTRGQHIRSQGTRQTDI